MLQCSIDEAAIQNRSEATEPTLMLTVRLFSRFAPVLYRS
jgi:hypothetical protein